MGRLRYCLDTSTVNDLFRDADRQALMISLREIGIFAVTSQNVLEAACTTDRETRVGLLRFLEELRGDYSPFPLPTALLSEALRGWHQHKLHIDLKASPKLMGVLARPEIVDAASRTELHGFKTSIEQNWEERHEKARHKFSELFAIDESARPETCSRWLKGLTETPTLDNFILDVFRASTGIESDDIDPRSLLAESEHLRLYLFTLGHSIYHRAIKQERWGKKGKPKTMDYEFAFYLPHCDWFFTSDSGQYRALRQARVLQNRCRRIVCYPQWRDRILVNGERSQHELRRISNRCRER